MSLKDRAAAAAAAYIAERPALQEAVAEAALRTLNTSAKVRATAAQVAADFPQTQTGQALAEAREGLAEEIGYIREDVADAVADFREEVALTVADLREGAAEIRGEVSERVDRARTAVTEAVADIAPVVQNAVRTWKGTSLF